MNPVIVVQLAAAAWVLVAMWIMLENFDRRNQDRFGALYKRVDELNDKLQIESLKGTLRAEMLEMRAELRSELREMGDRRVFRG
jgi:hypothetical protein